MVTAITGLTDSRFEGLQIFGPEGADTILELGTGSRVSDIWVAGGTVAAESLFHISGKSWVSIRNVVVNGLEGGPVVHIEAASSQITLDGIITNGVAQDLVIDNSNSVVVNNWLSSGAGDGAFTPVHILNSEGVAFTGSHFGGLGATSTGLAGVHIENSKNVSIDGSNLFSDFSPGANDRALFILEGCVGCTLSPNVAGLTGGTAFTSVDFLRVVGSDYNLISYGHYRPNGLFAIGNQPRHGITIDANSDGNVVVGNDFGHDPTRFTGEPIDDNGTDTQLFMPGNATYGDNFTDLVPGSGGGGGIGVDDVSQLDRFARSGELTVVAGTHKAVFPFAVTIVGVTAACGVAPTGADVIVDVHKNGTTIFTTQANRPIVGAGTTVGSEATPDVTSISAGEYLTVDIDQIGSTLPGEDLTVVVEWRMV